VIQHHSSYAAPAFNVDVCVTKDLSVCWNSVYWRLFLYNRWESVKCCIKDLERLDLVHMLALQKLKLWYNLRHSSNRTVYNMSMFLSMGNEYNTLLVNYACSATDSAGKLSFIDYVRVTLNIAIIPQFSLPTATPSTVWFHYRPRPRRHTATSRNRTIDRRLVKTSAEPWAASRWWSKEIDGHRFSRWNRLVAKLSTQQRGAKTHYTVVDFDRHVARQHDKTRFVLHRWTNCHCNIYSDIGNGKK